MSSITVSQGKALEDYVNNFKNNFSAGFISVLRSKISYFAETRDITSVYENIERLREALKSQPNGELINIPADVIPCLKRVLLTIRRMDATNYERAKKTTIHPELIDSLESKMKPLDELINQKWLRETEPMKMPRLTEYISIQQIREHWVENESSAREYDEKFHILQAPKHFQSDLKHFRWECEMRGASVIVAHIDIDNFKQFNSKYGHIEVDRRILPPFMRLLETHVFSHGFAYRYGGDEYSLLLPNMDYEMACDYLDSLRKKISDLRYPSVSEITTVSIGFCYLDSDSYLTNGEGEERANKAMSFAKGQGGKNCVASFPKASFDDSSLRVVRPLRNRS